MLNFVCLFVFNRPPREGMVRIEKKFKIHEKKTITEQQLKA